MPRGGRLIILAIAGLILTGNAKPVSQNARGKSAAAQSNESAAKNSDISAGVSRIGSALEAQDANSDPYEKERNEREIRNLKAQENSAYWAEMMFYATAIAVILSIIGIVLIYITFRATRQGADEARRNVDAFISAERSWLWLEIAGQRVKPDAKTVSLNVTGLARGRAGIEIVGIYWRQFVTPEFVSDETAYTFQDRAAIWDMPLSLQGIAGFEVPLNARFVGGWVSYRTIFAGERRSYFLCKIERGETNIAGEILYAAQRHQRHGWPEDT
jgi:hypothetical protein